ncbi:NAD-dependent epimerase/dehydratase family protein [Limibacter armeniacum]|uniref:NAD-dependent epimerase/dehydratase family protein n=1 Tax=Limibacter armeniacum TaxID=466084 RepID=UPI002FE5BDD1
MKINAIVTGSTGMVGKSVLIECLESEHVASVLIINRESLNIQHPKLKEIIHKDFSNISSIREQLEGYNACFYCMGVSALGMSEDDYFRITYSMTEEFATTLHELNPDMVFNYVSGTGTDSSERGGTMWARVKGKTENMVLQLGFKDAYAFRPGAILPEKGVKSKTGWYNLMYTVTKPLFPVFKKMDSVIQSPQIGQAMINSVLYPQQLKILENRDIRKLANQS